MKHLFKPILSIIILINLCGCYNVHERKNTKIRFDIVDYDFGQLDKNGKGDFVFSFSNVGDFPLIIDNIKTSCGCTVAQWSKKPVKPGKKDKIGINYDTSRLGVFNKTIYVFYNGKDSPISLNVRGNIVN